MSAVTYDLTLTQKQETAAVELNEGPVVHSYLDGGVLHMETRGGLDPYVWWHETWVPMRGLTW